MNKDRIRKILLDNGFTIKEGQTDLKPYVYKAAAAIFEEASYVPVHVPRGAHVNGPAWEDGFETGSADLRMAIKSVADALELASGNPEDK